MRYNQRWIEGLKVGDEVCIVGRGGAALDTISRMTPKQIIIERKGHSLRFWKKDGKQVSSDIWHWMYIAEPTPNRLEQIEIQKLRRVAIELRNKLPIPDTKEQLLLFIKVIKPFTIKE